MDNYSINYNNIRFQYVAVHIVLFDESCNKEYWVKLFSYTKTWPYFAKRVLYAQIKTLFIMIIVSNIPWNVLWAYTYHRITISSVFQCIRIIQMHLSWMNVLQSNQSRSFSINVYFVQLLFMRYELEKRNKIYIDQMEQLRYISNLLHRLISFILSLR